MTDDLATEFVNTAHANLARVREMLDANPELLHATANQGETELLLERGAPLDVCTAAMLGRRDDVARFLEADPAQANAKGAHGIPLMFHVALGGDVSIAEMVVARGGGEGKDGALHGAVARGQTAMVRWLLDNGVQDVNRLNFQQKTPLAAAVERGHEEIAALLRARGAHE
jgi:ankyrin repeat protein